MYPYKTVERALTRMHGDTGAAALRINAKVKHFIRLGFTPESPGKGQRIAYTFEDVARWAFGLKVLEFGLDPVEMIPVIERSWPKVWPVIKGGRWAMNELAIITPSAISQPHGWHKIVVDVKVGHMYQPNWDRVDRVMIVNLGRLTKDLTSALADAETGMLRDLSDEIASIKDGDARVSHIKSALKNATPGAELHVGSIDGSALVRERGADGVLRDLLPTPRKGRKARRDPAPAANPAEVPPTKDVEAPADPFRRGPRKMFPGESA